MTSAPAVGDTLIAGVSGDLYGVNEHVVDISETGVSWAKVVNSTWDSEYDSEIWLGTVSATANANVTITFSDSNLIAVADICEYSGLSLKPVDQVAVNQGQSSTSDTGTSSVTSQVNELFIGVTTTDVVQTSATNGFTLLGGQIYYGINDGASCVYLEKIVSSTQKLIVGQVWVGFITGPVA